MILCLTGTKLLEALLPDKEFNKDINYRPSIYNYIFCYGTKIFLYNTMSRRLAHISKAEAEMLTQRSICNSNFDSCTILDFVAKRFLVPNGTDEAEHYIQLYSTLRMYERGEKSGYTMFDILPTTCCNARCFYCFEAGVEHKNMSFETADAVFSFIKRERNPDLKTELSWFGGEPLCRTEIIDYICSKMREESIPFYSTMITNGYLWTPELINRAKKQWMLNKAQITFDGFEEEHNFRKAYRMKDPDPFYHTINNIHQLLEAGIAVVLRLNMDSKNIASIWNLYAYLKTEFNNKERIVFSPAILAENWFEWSAERTSAQQKEVRKQWRLLRADINESGFSRFAALERSLPKFHCMANSVNSVTVQPDGKLYMCQTGDSSMLYGNVWEGITRRDIVEQWSCNTNIRDMCRNCTWLPECTGFSMCPALPSDCDIEMEDKFIQRLKRTIQSLDKFNFTDNH